MTLKICRTTANFIFFFYLITNLFFSTNVIFTFLIHLFPSVTCTSATIISIHFTLDFLPFKLRILFNNFFFFLLMKNLEIYAVRQTIVWYSKNNFLRINCKYVPIFIDKQDGHLHAQRRISKYQFYRLWFDPT